MSNIQKLVQDNEGNTNTLLTNLGSQKISKDNAANTLEANNANRAATLFQSALANLPQGANLPGGKGFDTYSSDFNSLSDAEKAAVMGQEAYSQGIKAGLEPQAVWNGIQNAATAAYKQQNIDRENRALAEKTQNDVVRAQIAMMNAQTNLASKQAGMADAAAIAAVPGGTDYLSAFHNAAAGGGHSKDLNSTVLSTLSDYISNGDFTNAKTALTNYVLAGAPTGTKTIVDGLQQVSGIVPSLIAKINALPADQRTGLLTGNIQDLATKLGKNPDPALQTLGAEFGHLQLIYNANVFGKRAVVSNNPILNNLYPSIKDGASLNISTLQGLLNTANDTLNAEVKSKVGETPFSSIYGDSGVLGGAKPTWQGIPVGQTMINKKDGKTYTITASGPVLK